MAIEKGITEVADSEDEPMTSSPTAVSNEAAQDKLCAIAPVSLQERQDACQGADCTHQARVKSNANTTADNAEGLGGDRNNASHNVDASSPDETNVEFRDIVAVQDGAHVPAHVANTDFQHEDANRVADEDNTDVEFEYETEVMPVTQYLSVNDNEQQKPTEEDGQAAAQPLTSDFLIEDAGHTTQALPAMSPDTSAQATTTRISDIAPSGCAKPDSLLTTAMQEHVPRSSTSKAEGSENIPCDLRTDVVACGPATRLEEAAMYAQKATPLICLEQDSCGERQSKMGETSALKEVTDREFDISAPEQTAFQTQSDSLARPDAMSAIVAPPKTPQEVTLAELKLQKAALLASLGALPAIQVLMEETASSDAEMDNGTDEPTEADIMSAANKIVKEHIKLLHEYNELKDVGQGLMGLIADQRGVRIVEVQEEFGIDATD